MKILAAIPLLAMFIAPPSNPPEDSYPVHFQMLYVHTSHRQNSRHGEGIANIREDGQPTRGFQFTFDSCADFKARPSSEMPARWNSKNRLQLIVQRIDIGPNTTKEECILNGRLQNFKYEKVDGKPTEVPLATPPAAN